MLKTAIVVNAVSASNLWPFAATTAVKQTRVIAGENIPKAFAAHELVKSARQ